MVHQVFNSIGSHIYNGVVYENFNFGTNFHNSFEFNYIIKGEVEVAVNSGNIRLKSGECILIPPNMIHDLRKDGSNKFFTAVFSADFVQAFFKKGITVPFFKFTLEEKTRDYLSEYMIYTGTPELYTLKSCLYAICAQAEKLSDSSKSPTISTNFVLAVNAYISDNLTETFTRKDIAAALKYEEHYFSTLFNNNFKIGFNKYISLFRFENACELLLHTDRNIADIAFECGFSSIRSFNRIFREFSGKTPNQYRKSSPRITEPDYLNRKVIIPEN